MQAESVEKVAALIPGRRLGVSEESAEACDRARVRIGPRDAESPRYALEGRIMEAEDEVSKVIENLGSMTFVHFIDGPERSNPTAVPHFPRAVEEVDKAGVCKPMPMPRLIVRRAKGSHSTADPLNNARVVIRRGAEHEIADVLRLNEDRLGCASLPRDSEVNRVYALAAHPASIAGEL